MNNDSYNFIDHFGLEELLSAFLFYKMTTNEHYTLKFRWLYHTGTGAQNDLIVSNLHFSCKAAVFQNAHHKTKELI